MSVATSTRRWPALKFASARCAGVLALVAVNGLGGDARVVQLLGDLVGAVLGAGEDQGPRQRPESRSSCASSARLAGCARRSTPTA